MSSEHPGVAPGSLVLVTGGTGFLGSALLQSLQSSGYRTRAFQRSPASVGTTESIVGDIRDADAVRLAVAGADAVIHTAGLAHIFDGAGRAPFEDVNEVGTAVVAGAAVAAAVRKFVLVSSVSVYGGMANGGSEDAPLRPEDRYARSKAAAERSAVAAVAARDTRLTILRMATLYGAGDRGNVHRLMTAIHSGRFIWIGSGTNQKSLLHVDDAARACVMALNCGAAQIEVFNVSASPVTMRSVVEGLSAAVGRTPPWFRIPAGLALAAAQTASSLSKRGRAVHRTLSKWLADDAYPSDRFRDRCGFRPDVALGDGLQRQAAAWRKSGPHP